MGDSPNTGPQNGHLWDLNADILNVLMELVSDGIWDWNANTGYVYRNPGWYEMLGYTPHALENSVFTWENVIHSDDYPRVMSMFDDYIHQHTSQYRTEYRCRKKDGSYIWIEDRGYVVQRNADSSVARMIGAHRSIQERKHSLEQLEQRNQSLEALVLERTRELSRVNQQLRLQLEENRNLAERDALTGIANRYRLEKNLMEECRRAQRFRHSLAMIAMDIDDFKPINDLHGHAIGDAALLRVVEVLESCVRQGELLARWGGDEFMVVLPKASLEDAKGLAERIRQALKRSDATANITLSFGVVQLQGDEHPRDLMARADKALYRSKATGKDKISE